jgi:hypothetical protein
MTNDQLRAALADGSVHTKAELAPQFGVTFREIRRRVCELRSAPAGPTIEDVWTSAGAGYQLRTRTRGDLTTARR